MTVKELKEALANVPDDAEVHIDDSCSINAIPINTLIMTTQELQQDAIKRRKEVLNTILAEFEKFKIISKPIISKDCTLVNFHVLTTPFPFDFYIDLVTDKLVFDAPTHKQLTNISRVGEYPLTMVNINELLTVIQSYKNIYVPKFS